MAIADELALLKSTKASIKEKLTNKDLQPTEEFSTATIKLSSATKALLTAEEISQIEAMGYTLA